MKNKICKTCNIEKDLNEFYTQERINAKGEKYLYYHPSCKKCSIEKAKKNMYDNYDRHLEAVKKYDSKEEGIEKHRIRQRRYIKNGKQKKWQQENPDKIQQYNKNRKNKNHIISKAEWIACKQYFNNSCAYCGITEEEHRKINRNHDLHKEHVDDKGSVYLDNCVPSCSSCNSKKSDRHLNEWYNVDNKNYTPERYNKILQWITEDYKRYFEGYRERRKFKVKV